MPREWNSLEDAMPQQHAVNNSAKNHFPSQLAIRPQHTRTLSRGTKTMPTAHLSAQTLCWREASQTMRGSSLPTLFF